MSRDPATRAGSTVGHVGFNGELPFDAAADDGPESAEPEYVWVMLPAHEVPANGIDYRAVVNGEGPPSLTRREATPTTRPPDSPGVVKTGLTRARVELSAFSSSPRPNAAPAPAEAGQRWLDPDALAVAVADRVVEELRKGMTAAPPKVLANYDDAAAMLGITRAALEKRVQRHQLPPGSIVRTGDRVQFHIDRLREMKPRRSSGK